NLLLRWRTEWRSARCQFGPRPAVTEQRHPVRWFWWTTHGGRWVRVAPGPDATCHHVDWPRAASLAEVLWLPPSGRRVLRARAARCRGADRLPRVQLARRPQGARPRHPGVLLRHAPTLGLGSVADQEDASQR